MGVREKIKTNIRRNLNKEYIRQLLGILARKPILYAYGSTFSSVSDKYLNIFTIENIRDSYDEKKPVVFGSLFLPYEMFHALELIPFLPYIVYFYGPFPELVGKLYSPGKPVPVDLFTGHFTNNLRQSF